jgi:hypothetical protein
MTFVDPIVYATGITAGETVDKFARAFDALGASALSEDVPLTVVLGLSVVGLSLAVVRPGGLDRRAALALASLVLLVVVVAGLVCIGRFYAHYLIQLIVPASVLATYALSRLGGVCQAAALGAAALWWWAVPAGTLLLGAPGWHGSIDWDEVTSVAGYIQSHTAPGDGVFLYQNQALCLYHMSGRFPPTKVFMDHQLLPENRDAPGLLRESMAALERNPPRLVIRGDVGRTLPAVEAFLREGYVAATNIGSHTVLRRKTTEGGP